MTPARAANGRWPLLMPALAVGWLMAWPALGAELPQAPTAVAATEPAPSPPWENRYAVTATACEFGGAALYGVAFEHRIGSDLAIAIGGSGGQSSYERWSVGERFEVLEHSLLAGQVSGRYYLLGAFDHGLFAGLGLGYVVRTGRSSAPIGADPIASGGALAVGSLGYKVAWLLGPTLDVQFGLSNLGGVAQLALGWSFGR